MAFILAVGRTNHQQIAHWQHLAVAGFMREDAQAGAHVQFPDDGVVLGGLSPIRTIVLAVPDMRIEATELALRGDVIQAVPFHIRGTCGRRQQELPQASRHPWGRVLPKERAIPSPESQEDATVLRVVGVPAPRIIAAHIYCIADDHRTAKRFVSQFDAPEDVPVSSRIPVDRRIASLGLRRQGFRCDGRRGEWGHDSGFPRVESRDSIQSPLSLIVERRVFCRHAQGLPCHLCF